MIKWYPINLYILVTLERTPDGRNQVKLVRLPQQPQIRHQQEIIEFSAHRWGETYRGWTPDVNHTSLVQIVLCWSPRCPEPRIRDKVRKHLASYVKKLMAADEAFRVSIMSRLKGTGWYLGRNWIK
jgi:hypothetical protein